MQQLNLMATSMADYGFGRCDGHHEMVDLRRREKPRGGLAIGRRLSTASATALRRFQGRRPSGAAGVLLEVVLRAFQLFGASAKGS
jgi:hypothetical protein